jgi:hypothetical protein
MTVFSFEFCASHSFLFVQTRNIQSPECSLQDSKVTRPSCNAPVTLRKGSKSQEHTYLRKSADSLNILKSNDNQNQNIHAVSWHQQENTNFTCSRYKFVNTWLKTFLSAKCLFVWPLLLAQNLPSEDGFSVTAVARTETSDFTSAQSAL